MDEIKESKGILVWSKQQFNVVMESMNISDSNVEGFNQVAFISINDTEGAYSKPWFNENHSNVLNLHFDDVESALEVSPTNKIQCRPFTEEQGKSIIDFIESNKNKKQFIVHCAAGIARSGAVGLFINDYFGENYDEFMKNNPYVHPNGHITRTLNKLLREI
jgi:predicted protein tyrosine phosphatase